MKYCKKCLQPNTRPHIIFNEEGICGACIYEQEKANIDWDKRKRELEIIVKEAKEKAKVNKTYDCVIGVSGGKDSTLQALYCKEKLGLNVLLVNSVPDCITEIGRKNIENLVNKGFDLIQMRPNPVIAKKLAKKAFYEFGNPMKPSEYCLWASAYQIADKFNIPLIIQGENAALTLGTSQKQDKSEDAFSVVDLNTLNGCNAKDWVDEDLKEEDLQMYQMPDIEILREKGIKAIFLQYFMKEWSQVGNADFSIARGLIGRSEENLYEIGRYRRYTALDADISILNQMLKYYKFGFGFATDEACYDIREGRLDREEAKWLINEYDGKCGEKYILEFCEYIGISKEEFWKVVESKIINKELFYKDANCKWHPRFIVGEGLI